MSAPTPVRDGFRAIWRQPSIFLAELSWRWSWGSAALLLTGLSLFVYLHTLIVTPTDLMLLRLRHPLAVSRALGDIFQGSGPRVVRATVLLLPALTALWIVLASLGRFATLRGIIAGSNDESRRGSIRILLGLHSLRVSIALAGFVSFLGAALVASFVSTPTSPRSGLAFLLFVPLAILISMVWSGLNWFLSLAPIFTVRDGEDTFGAIATTVDFCRRCGGKLSAAGFWFGAMHLVAFVIGTTVVMYPLAVASLVPPGVTLILMALVVLAYIAAADFLYVARLAAYVAIVEWDRTPAAECEVAAFVKEPPATINPPGPGGDTLEEDGSDDEPLFSGRPFLLHQDRDEPLMPGVSPGEPLPRR